MAFLKIEKCLPFGAFLFFDEKTKKRVELVLQFYGIDAPKVGDHIFLHESLLDKKNKNFTQPYCFELFEGDFPQKEFDAEFAVLKTDDKVFVLKRVYG